VVIIIVTIHSIKMARTRAVAAKKVPASAPAVAPAPAARKRRRRGESDWYQAPKKVPRAANASTRRRARNGSELITIIFTTILLIRLQWLPLEKSDVSR
jgi:hypothetical protein